MASSFMVPSLSKRSASSTVELMDGQTIGIAGLINEDLREAVHKFPGLGSIPILGALFRSQQFIKGETELVILVTPRLARPLPKDRIRLPTDDSSSRTTSTSICSGAWKANVATAARTPRRSLRRKTPAASSRPSVKPSSNARRIEHEEPQHAQIARRDLRKRIARGCTTEPTATEADFGVSVRQMSRPRPTIRAR